MTQNLVVETFKIEIRMEDQIIQPFCKIGSPQEIRWSLFNLWKCLKAEKIKSKLCQIIWNLLNDEEFWPLKVLKLKYRRGDQISQGFCRIDLPQEIRSLHSLICENFKSTIEWCTMHWNLMNDEEFSSLKISKLKYRRGDQIINSPKEIGPHSLVVGNLKALRKVLLNQLECIEI